MLGDFIYSGEIEDASYQYDVPINDKTQKIEKTIKRFFGLAAVFISIGLVWIFCVSPAMVPVKIDVKSFPGLSKPDVLNIAGIRSGATYISVNAREAEDASFQASHGGIGKGCQTLPRQAFDFS